MYFSLIVLFVTISGSLTINCPNTPSKWCETRDIARACRVVKQCQTYVWQTRDTSERVNFSIYYETLCPDCRQFITTQVWNVYQSILNIVNVTFVPYGNAKELYRPETKLYQYYCQHGVEECYGNLIHACVIHLYPQTEQHMPFIYCTESTDGEMETVASQCAEKTQIDYDQVTACTHSRLGNQLQHAYAVETENLKPKHEYVPWITLNGEHTEDMQKQAEKDLIGLLCQSYKGPSPPAQCVKNLSLAIDCPIEPSRWCETKETAHACRVTRQCESFVWNVKNSNDKVNVSLYYETLCPYCRQFITGQLVRAYQLIPEIINITIVPYGNAHETYDSSTQTYKFTCQHGPDECVGNIIHSCVLNFYPAIEQYIGFVNCTEAMSGDMKTVSQKCAEKTQVDYAKIDACASGPVGNQLQHLNALKTESLQPQHQYVPWIVVNGQHTEQIQDEAQKNLVQFVCKTYTGSNPPAACNKYF